MRFNNVTRDHTVEDFTCDDCPFEGDVDGYSTTQDGGWLIEWSCPSCGSEHDDFLEL